MNTAQQKVEPPLLWHKKMDRVEKLDPSGDVVNWYCLLSHAKSFLEQIFHNWSQKRLMSKVDCIVRESYQNASTTLILMRLELSTLL